MCFLKKIKLLSTLILIILISLSCIKKIALKKVAGALTGEGGTVFTSDNDPQLIADALPFALKTYESLLEGLPEDDDLLLATGKAFCMYAYAFIHSPADTISDVGIIRKNRQYIRAKNMYLRARDYLLRALEIRHPGFSSLLDKNLVDSALTQVNPTDSTLLYWCSMAWMGAYTADKFDIAILVSISKPVKIMQYLLKHYEGFGDGAVHNFFISYYGSMPESMGGDKKKAREHFNRSVEISKGKIASPYVSLATSVCVAKQNHEEYKELLEKALKININDDIGNRLLNIITQIKAKWLLDNISNFFLIDNNEEGEFEEEF